MEARELANGTQFVAHGYVYEKVGDQFINGTLDCTLVQEIGRVTPEGIETHKPRPTAPMNPYANVEVV